MNKKLLCLTPLLALMLCGMPAAAEETEANAAAYVQDFQKMEGFGGPQIRAADPLFSAIGENPAIGAAAQVVNKTDIAFPAGTADVPGGALPDFTDDLGDFSFFKSDYIIHRYVAYPNTTLYPKSNEIVCEKFDYQNPNKGDRIIFNKTGEEDCYIDTAAKIFRTYRSGKAYKYFKLSGEFMCDFKGDSSLYLFQLRENRGAGGQVNVYPITVNGDGSIKLVNGRTVSGAPQRAGGSVSPCISIWKAIPSPSSWTVKRCWTAPHCPVSFKTWT